jgi:DNA replication and repair protein RecF
MFLSLIKLNNFRNYKELYLEIPKEGALFTGLNGSGKTNLLEAIFFICAARSYRGAKRAELINVSSDFAFIEGIFFKNGNNSPTQISIGFSRDKKISMKINNRAVLSFSQLIGNGIAISFMPEDINLVLGAPAERRTLLDIFISQIDPLYLDALIMYKKNLDQRNYLLQNNISNEMMCVYEENMAEYGAKIFCKRKIICAEMAPFFSDFYSYISNNSEAVRMEYFPSFGNNDIKEKDWKQGFLDSLIKSRSKDLSYGFTSFGPHRDDIKFFINNNNAKDFASMGQCCSISISLKMSLVFLGEKYKNEKMIFLFDDATGYLDEERASKVFPKLVDKGQIFVTAPYDRGFNLTSLPHFIIKEGRIIKK